jgi:hypothetical protein
MPEDLPESEGCRMATHAGEHAGKGTDAGEHAAPQHMPENMPESEGCRRICRNPKDAGKGTDAGEDAGSQAERACELSLANGMADELFTILMLRKFYFLPS